MKKSNLFQYPAAPSDYRDHRELALSGLNLWENCGWMVWDRVEDEDVLLWASPYRIIGKHPESPFAVEDVALSQTVLLRVNHQGEERLRMHDDPFLAIGYDFGDYLPGSALQVRIDEKSAVWSIGDRRFSAEPPVWSVQGKNHGVDLDLKLDLTGPVLWLTDPSHTVEETQERWLLACAKATGTITHQGKTLKINGFASHERHVHCGTRYDPIRLLSSRGITFHALAFEGRQVLICSRPSLGLAWARLILPDRVVDFSGDEYVCEVEELEQWIDPQSRLQTPCRWRCVFRGPEGSLELEGRAFSRAFYTWPQFKWGSTVLYWWLGDASVRYNLASGEAEQRDGVQYMVHDNRLLYRQHRDD